MNGGNLADRNLIIFFVKGKINLEAVENFRNSVKTKAEILNDQNFLIQILAQD